MKLGCLSYINAFPVTLGLELGEVEFQGERISAEPTRLNALTRRGELDITAISSIEYLSCWQTYRVVEGVALSSPGAVLSVRLFSRIPLAELPGRRVAVTTASATSRALLQILIPGIQVVSLQGAPELSEEQPAVLLIGDQALTSPLAAPYGLDLGEAWHQRTGYPMVFALWLARRSLPHGYAEEVLHRSRRWGEQNRDRVLQEAQLRTGLAGDLLDRYYRGLHYYLGARERESLELFYRLAGEHGLAEVPPQLLTKETVWNA